MRIDWGLVICFWVIFDVVSLLIFINAFGLPKRRKKRVFLILGILIGGPLLLIGFVLSLTGEGLGRFMRELFK